MSFLHELAMCLYWYRRPLIGSDYCKLAANYVAHISQYFPDISTVRVDVHARPQPIALGGSVETLERQIESALPSAWAYLTQGSESRSYTPTARSTMGFSALVCLGGSGIDGEIAVEMCVGKSDDRAPNTVVARFPSALENPVFLDEFFRRSIGYWRPSHGSVSRPIFDDAVDQPLGEIRVGWLTYLPTNAAVLDLPNELRMSAFADGVLVSIRESVPSADDSTAIDNLRELHALLAAHGWLSNPRDRG